MASVQVVTRTKDRPLFLERALHSIVQQTFNGWHCTIVNDGGNPVLVDSAVNQLDEAVRKKISVVHNPASVGMEAASNIGLKDYLADYYVIHDDDDSWAPDFLEKAVSCLNESSEESVQGVVAHTIKVHEEIKGGQIVEKKTSSLRQGSASFTIPRIIQNNPFLPIAFVYTHKALVTLGGYDEGLPVVGDWEFNIRFISKFDIAYLESTSAYYHVRTSSTGGSADNSISKDRLHRHYRTLIINKYIRQSLRRGDISLAHIFVATEPGRYVNRFGELLDVLNSRIGKLRNMNWLSRLWVRK